MTTLEELKKGLSIDLEGLHRDAQEQPGLACDSAELGAEAKAEAKRAKLRLEEVKAAIQRTVRANPEAAGIDKVTEASIAAAVTVSPEVMRVSREAIDAEEAAAKAEAVATAYDHRRSMIKNEVELWQANYWSQPEVKERDMRRAVQGAETALEDKVTAAAGRKRRRMEDE